LCPLGTFVELKALPRVPAFLGPLKGAPAFHPKGSPAPGLNPGEINQGRSIFLGFSHWFLRLLISTPTFSKVSSETFGTNTLLKLKNLYTKKETREEKVF
jgi:hypothetical protein